MNGVKGAAAVAAVFVLTTAARADDDWLSLHGQSTVVVQYHPAFTSPYRGPNSLAPQSVGDETFDATVFVGIRLWDGASIYANPEIDQGFGLSDTLGVAGFPSGEAYKVGASTPYYRLQRLFARQVIDLGGASQTVDDGVNQIAGATTANNLILTAGKFSVGDVFDTNQYAHDPRGDFLNWSLIDAGAFDYAADAWGYASGVSAEWTEDWWTLRAGIFNLSKIPNGKHLETNFEQFESVIEGEERHTLFGHDGKVKLLAYMNRGRMGTYADALALAAETQERPNTALVRRYRSRFGGELNVEQGLTDDLGAFLRASANDGRDEAYEFTEINRSLSAGLSLKGNRWDRANDTVGVAGVVNDISGDARNYFAAGGLGILIGDGRLPHYGSEDILEAYYSAQLAGWFTATADYQFVANPAYNRDRGPVSAITARLHAQF